jgi:hypothetical protein
MACRDSIAPSNVFIVGAGPGGRKRRTSGSLTIAIHASASLWSKGRMTSRAVSSRMPTGQDRNQCGPRLREESERQGALPLDCRRLAAHLIAIAARVDLGTRPICHIVSFAQYCPVCALRTFVLTAESESSRRVERC